MSSQKGWPEHAGSRCSTSGRPFEFASLPCYDPIYRERQIKWKGMVNISRNLFLSSSSRPSSLQPANVIQAIAPSIRPYPPMAHHGISDWHLGTDQRSGGIT